MIERRLLPRLAVAVITFVIGLAAASLFGAATPARFFAWRSHPRVVFVPYNAGPGYSESSPPPPCGSFRTRQAFERHAWQARAFDFDAPPPPPAPQPPRYSEP